MSETAQRIQIPLKRKCKTLLNASVLASYYSLIAYIIMLLITWVGDEEALKYFRVTISSTVIFLSTLELAWLAGLFLPGLIVWVLAEKLGFTSRRCATLAGIILPTSCALIIEHYVNILEPWNTMITVALVIIGAKTGRYLWNQTYGTAVTPASAAAH